MSEMLKRTLLREMRRYSEDRWCAGWMHELEFEIWRSTHDNECADMIELGLIVGGWWIWDGDPKFIDMPDWLEQFRLHEATSEKFS